MLCDPCRGSGFVDVWRVISDGPQGRQRTHRREPCPNCAGTGSVSCCEGSGRDACDQSETGEAE